MIDVLTIDNIKHLAHGFDKKPEYFGLGFIQLKLTEKERLHFYSKELEPILPEEDMHDHRYDFRSLVMKGALTNKLWFYDNAVEETTKELAEVSCSPDDSRDPKIVLKNINVFSLGEFTTLKGDHYKISSRVFHQVDWEEDTVTQVVRGPILQEFAHVLRDKVNPYVCPFSAPMGEAKAWEWIEKIIQS